MPTSEIAVFIDLPNLLINMNVGPDPYGFKAERGFERMLEKLKSIGEIESVFVFASTKTPTMHLYQSFFYNLGFTVITCPHLDEEGDTTDNELIKLAQKFVENYRNITHFCLVSGDHHFVKILKKAKERGLKIIIVTSCIDPLSNELIPLADLDPQEKKMIYFFSALIESPEKAKA